MPKTSDKKKIDALFDSMTPISGENRVVYRCPECKGLYGRRFIPHGIGSGLTVGLCLCNLTRNAIKGDIVETRIP